MQCTRKRNLRSTYGQVLRTEGTLVAVAEGSRAQQNLKLDVFPFELVVCVYDTLDGASIALLWDTIECG